MNLLKSEILFCYFHDQKKIRDIVLFYIWSEIESEKIKTALFWLKTWKNLNTSKIPRLGETWLQWKYLIGLISKTISVFLLNIDQTSDFKKGLFWIFLNLSNIFWKYLTTQFSVYRNLLCFYSQTTTSVN